MNFLAQATAQQGGARGDLGASPRSGVLTDSLELTGGGLGISAGVKGKRCWAEHNLAPLLVSFCCIWGTVTLFEW